MTEVYQQSGDPHMINPVFKQSSTVLNVRLDTDAVAQRKANVQGSTYYLGSLDDVYVGIEQFDIVYRMRSNTRTGELRAPAVLASLAGAFAKGQTPLEIIAAIEIMGVAMTPARFDSTNKNKHSGCVSMQSGMSNLINNGEEFIPARTLIYADIPDLMNPYDKSNRLGKRILLSTRPYDPAQHRVTLESMRRHLLNPRQGEKKNPIAQGGKEIMRAFLASIPNFMNILMMLGLVQHTPQLEAALRDQTVRNGFAREYATKKKEVADYLIGLSTALDLISGHRNDITTNIPMPHSTSSKKAELRTALISSLLNAEVEAHYLIVPFEPGTKEVPPGPRGALLNNQINLMKSMLSGIGRANAWIAERIIGRSITEAEPGTPFDIQVGGATIAYLV